MNEDTRPNRIYPESPLLGASACIWNGSKVLLVLGARPPKENLWSLPGGLVEVGETLEEAAHRELLEETSIKAEMLGLADWVEIIRRDDAGVKYHYVIALFLGRYQTGELKAADDAKDASWFSLDELEKLKMTDGTAELIHKTYAAWFP